MRPIETRYAGRRFRSRLEARWAVVFDDLGWTWEHEPQGFECAHRITGADRCHCEPQESGHGPHADEWGGAVEGADCPTWPAPHRYLPDFWLPDPRRAGGGLWAEVKGEWRSDEEIRRFADCAAQLSVEGGYGCDHRCADVLLLGHLDVTRLPLLLHMHKGELGGSAFDGTYSMCSSHQSEHYADDGGSVDLARFRSALSGVRPTPGGVGPTWARAIDRGLSARFEHGESG